jgi:hypothetical protein
MNAVERARISALVFFGLAAVAIAAGALYVIVTPLDATGAAIIPAALAGVGAAIMLGVGFADLRYARRLERHFMERIDQ